MNDKQHLDLYGHMMLQRAASMSVLAMLDKWYEEHGQKIDGMSPGEWFSTYLPAFLDREMEGIRATDPAFAERLATHMGNMRGPV
jgi:hypothetical protein